MDKRLIRLKLFNFLGKFGDKIKEKFVNICSKTGNYSVPDELFQKRTSRKNRVLFSWKTIKRNRLTYEQLNTFEGGIVVEFVNNDYFENDNSDLFNLLKTKIGSDENVSAIISIRSEEGTSSSQIQREAFAKLTNNTEILYKNRKIVINNKNYTDYVIKQDVDGQGQGNETWSGFIYISIKGGQQDTITTHEGLSLTLFNPACEYASSDVIEDIYLVMGYYALFSIDEKKIKDESIEKWNELKFLQKNVENVLKEIKYNFPEYKGNLLDFVNEQYCLTFNKNSLTDPIQFEKISIEKFNISDRTEDSIDVTHQEAVIWEKYYWDKEKECILSPARPTNLFWSFHLSNMMQQNYNLDEYFAYEETRFKKREKLIKQKRVE